MALLQSIFGCVTRLLAAGGGRGTSLIDTIDTSSPQAIIDTAPPVSPDLAFGLMIPSPLTKAYILALRSGRQAKYRCRLLGL